MMERRARERERERKMDKFFMQPVMQLYKAIPKLHTATHRHTTVVSFCTDFYNTKTAEE